MVIDCLAPEEPEMEDGELFFPPAVCEEGAADPPSQLFPSRRPCPPLPRAALPSPPPVEGGLPVLARHGLLGAVSGRRKKGPRLRAGGGRERRPLRGEARNAAWGGQRGGAKGEGGHSEPLGAKRRDLRASASTARMARQLFQKPDTLIFFFFSPFSPEEGGTISHLWIVHLFSP